MKKLVILLIGNLFSCHLLFADELAEIKTINQKVDMIEQSRANLNMLELKLHTGEFENVPPNVMYYYKPDNLQLMMLKVSVGHEIFLNKFTYYFENNRIIKFLKETEGHPDSPPKYAIIYNADGRVLWKNIEEPKVLTKTVLELFEKNMSMLVKFSTY